MRGRQVIGDSIEKTATKVVALPHGAAASPPDPLSELYLRFRRDIVEFVRRKFGPGPPEPEDVAQAVFLQVAAQSRVELIQNPRSFLLKSAQNVVLDYHRRNARQLNPARELEHRRQQSVSDFDVERVVTGEERLKMLMSLLARQPPAKRQMVLLSRIHGWSCEAIGRRLGVSGEAVQKQIERVLKECLVALRSQEQIAPERVAPDKKGRARGGA